VVGGVVLLYAGFNFFTLSQNMNSLLLSGHLYFVSLSQNEGNRGMTCKTLNKAGDKSILASQNHMKVSPFTFSPNDNVVLGAKYTLHAKWQTMSRKNS